MKKKQKRRLTPFLSPAKAWAYSLGTSMGWGAVVVTCNTYLTQAGPLGSTLGLFVGAAVMLVIARNYHYLMNCFPETGGAYAFTCNALGYDQGFAAAWFSIITYLAMLWANATSLPFFARFFFGDAFEFGHMYTIFGYDVYFGEALLSISAIVVVAFLCSRRKKVTSWVMLAMAALFAGGIALCFVISMFRHREMVTPQFIPDVNRLTQVTKVAAISPWAFIGFESFSHASEEFQFEHKKSFKVLSVSVISAALLYIAVILLSVSCYPPRYDSWLAYIRDLPNLNGLEAIPAFFAAQYHLGNFGVTLLLCGLFSLIVTSLIGNTFVLCRIFYALAQDHVISQKFGEVNDRGTAENAIILVACVSAVVPFLGRTAIGWIVDVTTLGSTLIYAFVSLSALKVALTRDDKVEVWTGGIGLLLAVGFQLYLLGLNAFTSIGSIDKAAFFLFVVWSIIGMLVFRNVLRRDKKKRFGRSLSVWVVLLSYLLLISLVWMRQSVMERTEEAIVNIQQHYARLGKGADLAHYNEVELQAIRYMNSLSVIVVVLLFVTAIVFLMMSYATMRHHADKNQQQLDIIQEMANTDPLTGVRSKHAYAEREKTVNAAIEAHHMSDFSVVVCDVNGLKFVNDTYGHKAGDEYIKSAGEMLKGIFRHSVIYRTGGDEFVVYLTGRDYRNRDKLMQELHDQSVAHIGEGTVVVSGGVSDFVPDQDRDVRAVFERADALMYEEKQNLKRLGAKTRD